MRRCMGCMHAFDEQYEVCPKCGYVVGTAPKEAYHLRPETELLGKYVVGRVLGNGGFGVTYLGWDNTLNHKVAIKEYFPGEFSTRVPGETQVSVFSGERSQQFIAGKEKFIEEAQRLARFNKTKGVVHVYDYFDANGTAYIIMEYLDGETYKDKMKRVGLLSPEEARDVIIEVLEALVEVHKEGIIHRDIAPDNIMMTKAGEVTLLDFGASRFATTKHSKSLSVILKPGYAPEEQYRSRGDQGPWTDMYAVAATFYKMVTGITPQASIERSARDLVKKPSKLGIKIPRNLENAVMNALNIRIEARTQNATDFLNALHAEKVKRKREKIKATDIGKWPIWLKVTIPTATVAVLTFLFMLSNGIISFKMGSSSRNTLAEGMARVPNVVNMTYEDAVKKIEEANLKINISEREYSNNVPVDRVLSQTVKEGTVIEENTIIDVVVSAGIERFYVPDTVGMFYQDVYQELDRIGVKWDSLAVASEEPPALILCQNLEPGVEVTDDVKMVILVSTGLPSFDRTQKVVMQDYVGKRLDATRLSLRDSMLYTYVSEEIQDETLPYGYITAQSVEAKTNIDCGTTIEFTVNTAHGKTTVPKIVGERINNIQSQLEEAYFDVDISYEYDSNVAKDRVISASYSEGENVDVGATLSLVVSLGKEQKTTSSSSGNREGGVVGGWFYSYGNYVYRDVPEGTMVTVPDIVGKAREEASAELAKYHLLLSGSSYIYEYSDMRASTITGQYPLAGDQVPAYTQITYRISKGPEYVSVPNVMGMTKWTAYCTLLNAGLSASYPYEDSESVVTGMSVDPGTMVGNGSYIWLYSE